MEDQDVLAQYQEAQAVIARTKTAARALLKQRIDTLEIELDKAKRQLAEMDGSKIKPGPLRGTKRKKVNGAEQPAEPQLQGATN